MIIVPLVTAGLLALQFWAEWWAAQGLLSTFQDVTKYTIGGIISNLCHGSRDRGSYKDFIVNEALQEEINL